MECGKGRIGVKAEVVVRVHELVSDGYQLSAASSIKKVETVFPLRCVLCCCYVLLPCEAHRLQVGLDLLSQVQARGAAGTVSLSNSGHQHSCDWQFGMPHRVTKHSQSPL